MDEAMTLFLELLAIGLAIAIVVLLPISYGLSKLFVREPPDLARLFRRRARPSIQLAVIETHVEAANTVVEKPPVMGPRSVLMSGIPSYVALATVIQTERRMRV
jgi:hypothetical protein